jgi:putative phage-type endonuclease
MAVTIIKPKTHADWLECRKQGIGSSEVATIMGINPYETPYQLWRRKKGIDAPKEENFFMKAGHYLEDAVSQFYQDATGRKVIKSSAIDYIIQDKEKPYLQVSPDRTYWIDAEGKKNNANKGIVECKTTQMQIDKEDLPKHWFCQLQYQLGVAGLKEGSIAWLTAGREFGYQDLMFHEELFSAIVESVEKFWVDNIIGNKEPNILNATDVAFKFNKHLAGKITEVNEDIFNTYTELKDAIKALAEIEEKKEELETKIKLAFADAEAISYQGKTLATWKSSKDTEKFDSKAFLSKNPDLAKDLMVSVQGTRRFVIK